MISRLFRLPVVSLFQAIATRIGHDLVWLAIAALFCVVEAIVQVTELNPARLLRARHASSADTSATLRSRPVGTNA